MKRFKSQPNKAGFTLLELMVVMMLMGLMATMLIVAVRGYIGTAREKATQATILKLHGLFSDRTKSFDRWIKEFDKRAGKGRLPDYVDQRRNVATSDLRRTNWSPGDAITPQIREQAKLIARKRLFAEKFPQLFSDDPGIPNSVKSPLVATDEYESSECFFYAIVNSQVFGAESVEDDAFTADEVQDTDGDGLREFVDNWGRPIRFYRWPTRLLRPASTGNEGTPSNTNSIVTSLTASGGESISLLTILGALPSGNGSSIDPDDMFGDLNGVSPSIHEMYDEDSNWNGVLDPNEDDGYNPSNPATFPPDNQNGRLDHLVNSRNTWFSPLIISAGPDGVLGLYEPNDRIHFGTLAQPNWSELNNLTDNITNLNLPAGGN